MCYVISFFVFIIDGCTEQFFLYISICVRAWVVNPICAVEDLIKNLFNILTWKTKEWKKEQQRKCKTIIAINNERIQSVVDFSMKLKNKTKKNGQQKKNFSLMFFFRKAIIIIIIILKFLAALTHYRFSWKYINSFFLFFFLHRISSVQKETFNFFLWKKRWWWWWRGGGRKQFFSRFYS